MYYVPLRSADTSSEQRRKSPTGCSPRDFVRPLRNAYRAAAVGAVLIGAASNVFGQIVINEFVKEERTADGGVPTGPDSREFVEFYNAGSTTADLSEVSFTIFDLITGEPTDSYLLGGTIAPGDFFVMGDRDVPNVDFTPVDAPAEMFPDLAANAMVLHTGLAPFEGLVQDAVAYDIYRAGTSFSLPVGSDQIGEGFQGQLISVNHPTSGPNARESWSRYHDGHDTNNNGRDFGILPMTPGASNNLPLNENHTVPNVDSLATGSVLPQYHASFVLPRVIDPGVVDAANPRVIPASPQGGKAIAAWDQNGGGNAVYSKELVNSFDIYAYFDTTPLGVAAETQGEEWESQIYGIGSADAFFGTPDPFGDIFVPGTITQNASTGIGWVYQQYEEELRGVAKRAFTRLMLVDFGDGGNSSPEAMEWKVIHFMDLSGVPSAWYRLGLDYEPQSGQVIATFDDQRFMFTTDTNLLGTFFVGYREAITNEQSRLNKLNPPIYDLFEAELTSDFNDDGRVDGTDLTVWKAAFGVNADADADGDGDSDGGDFLVWQREVAIAGVLIPVPEPRSHIGLLMVIVWLGIAGRQVYTN